MIDLSTFQVGKLPSLPLAQRQVFPDCPAIYFALSESGDLLYVGRTRCLIQRWKDHHHFGALTCIGGVRIAWMKLQECQHLLPEIERALIRHFRPPLNGPHYCFPKKTERLPIPRDPELWARVRRASEFLGLSTSDFIRRALAKEVDRLARRHPELTKQAA